jgi:Zn-dependent protease
VFYLLATLLIHELGHLLLMKLYKYENIRMLFIPMIGAFVQGNKERYSIKESFFVISAGPFPGIYIGLFFLIFSCFFEITWMFEFSFFIFFLNIINLLPIDPLDGGQLFKLLVYRKRDLFLLIFSSISSLTLIGIGLLINSWLLVFFGWRNINLA